LSHVVLQRREKKDGGWTGQGGRGYRLVIQEKAEKKCEERCLTSNLLGSQYDLRILISFVRGKEISRAKESPK